MIKRVIGLLIVLIILILPACALMPEVIKVEGEERDQVVAMAEPMIDNLFAGMVAADYATFSRDFDDTMKKGLNEAAFNELIASFDEKLGEYQSREVDRVEQVENLVVVYYQAHFEKEETVNVSLSIRQGGETPQVAGLWFDSPKLREE